MAIKEFNIKEFGGIDQSRDESRINPGDTADACNMDTTDGNLAVAKGYVQHIMQQVPGEGWIKRLYVWRGLVTVRYIVIAGLSVYAYVDTDTVPAWNEIYTFAEIVGNRWDFLETKIEDTDYLIIANGEHQMIKWDGITAAAELFGSGLTVLETTVSTYTAGTKTVVLVADITDLAKERMEQVGIVIADLTYPVSSVNQATKSVVLSSLTGTPATGNAVKVRGGISDVHVNFLAMHYSRLFAAGDPDNPSRLYWSAPPGTSGTTVRTIEDWSRDDASENTSGGYVEIGNTGGDPITGLCPLSNQLLIFKRGSIYRLLGDRPSNFRILRVDAEVEEMVDTSVIFYGDTPFWMTKAGMCYFDGQTAQKMFNARNIQGILADASLDACKGAENRDKLYFSIRENRYGYDDNAVIVYDVQRRTYMMRRGFEVADLFAVNGVLYMINNWRYVYRFDEGNTHGGTDLEAYWKTPLTDLDSKSEIKTLQTLLLRGEGDPLIIDVTVGRNTTNYRYFMPEELSDISEIPLKNEGRMFSVRFSNEADGSWKIRGGITILFEPRRRPL